MKLNKESVERSFVHRHITSTNTAVLIGNGLQNGAFAMAVSHWYRFDHAFSGAGWDNLRQFEAGLCQQISKFDFCPFPPA
jgi:hypothetical protein